MSDPTLTVSDAIAELVSSTGSTAERRELRAALSHVDAELGTMPLRDVRPRDVTALLNDLREAGLSERRETTLVGALDLLFAFAGDSAPAPTPTPMPTPTPTPMTTQTPTLTMLTLGARAAVWTAWAIAIVFVLLLVALVLQLS
jgi:hypothetical protein